MMECPQAKALLDAYVDAELDARSSVEVETHAKDCAICARLLENRKILRSALRSADLSFAAPDSLRRKIMAATAAPAREGFLPSFTFKQLAVSFAVFALVVSGGALRWRSVTRENLLVDDLIAGHVRSLQADHLTDVKSSEKHTVKPWFTGKLDFSPAVEDFYTDGYPLVGGRLDYLDGRAVAALAYRRGAHTVNVFIWPAAGGDDGPRARSERGYNLTHWSRGGMSYWAVSDLNATELSSLVDLLISRGIKPAPEQSP